MDGKCIKGGIDAQFFLGYEFKVELQNRFQNACLYTPGQPKIWEQISLESVKRRQVLSLVEAEINNGNQDVLHSSSILEPCQWMSKSWTRCKFNGQLDDEILHLMNVYGLNHNQADLFMETGHRLE